MFREGDTIAAISTPLGEGAIAIVRISGPGSIRLVQEIFRLPGGRRLRNPESHRVYYGHIVDPGSEETLDEVLITVMLGPRSYTREDLVEIGCHGGTIAVKRVLGTVLAAGARLAEPGEFTRRAFLNGRIDLAQAEAVLEIIRAKGEAASRLALGQLEGLLSKRVRDIREKIVSLLSLIEASVDFPDDVEEVRAGQLFQGLEECLRDLEALLSTWGRGRLYKEGVKVGIIGRPNVGKSSLLNALLGERRAIVTEVPGTTRDVIEEDIDLGGIRVRLLDTAGIRHTDDPVERVGVDLASEVLRTSDLVLLVIDGSSELTEEDLTLMGSLPEGRGIVVLNKIDLPLVVGKEKIDKAMNGRESLGIVGISASEGLGLEGLKDRLEEVILGGRIPASEECLVINLRHKEALETSRVSLLEALNGLKEGIPLDLVAIDLKEAGYSLGQITGIDVGEAVIDRIFSEFCVGK